MLLSRGLLNCDKRAWPSETCRYQWIRLAQCYPFHKFILLMDTFDSFHCYFSSAVGMRVCYRGKSMIHTPGFEKFSSLSSSELRSTVRCQLYRYPKCYKGFSEAFHQAICTRLRLGNHVPIGVPVYYDDVIMIIVRKIIAADLLECKGNRTDSV